MNEIKPMKGRHVPAYPTIDEISRADLSRAPSRWSGLKSAVASIGTAAMALRALALDAAEGADVAAAPSVEVAGRVKEKPAKAVSSESSTDVCPLASIAVAGKGRGGFGCMAINPPVMLGELDALEIIEKEFLARGVKLKDGPELDGVSLPAYPEWKRPVMLDLGTESGDIMVEFISTGDTDRWKKPDPDASKIRFSYSTFDCREAASNAVETISARKGGKKVAVGVFYEPVVYVPRDWKPSPDDIRLKREDRGVYGKTIAREQLKAQIDAFFDYLSKKGIRPVNGHAPHAASH